MPTLTEELREVVRLFLSMLCLDTEEDCAEVSRALEIEHQDAMWNLAQRARSVYDLTSPQDEK